MRIVQIGSDHEKAVMRQANEAGSKGDVNTLEALLDQLLLPRLGSEVMALAKTLRWPPRGRGI
ncbi:MAG: hypothetical protein WC880_00480 [Candidatus Paceibacterota bacterium]